MRDGVGTIHTACARDRVWRRRQLVFASSLHIPSALIWTLALAFVSIKHSILLFPKLEVAVWRHNRFDMPRCSRSPANTVSAAIWAITPATGQDESQGYSMMLIRPQEPVCSAWWMVYLIFTTSKRMWVTPTLTLNWNPPEHDTCTCIDESLCLVGQLHWLLFGVGSLQWNTHSDSHELRRWTSRIQKLCNYRLLALK